MTLHMNLLKHFYFYFMDKELLLEQMVLKSIIRDVSKKEHSLYMYTFNCVIQTVERKNGWFIAQKSLIFALPYPPGSAV